MSGYPRGIMAAYASGAITREQFKSRLAAWQRSRGIDYVCRGTCRGGTVGMTYRGRRAVLTGGSLAWIGGEYAGTDGETRYVRETAGNAAEFRRKVDIAICGQLRGLAWT